MPPEAAVGWLDIRIHRFGYDLDLRTNEERLALLLLSELDEGQGRHMGMWRVEFEQVWAFRMSGSARWFSRLPVTEQPPERGLWEVAHSQWLKWVVEFTHGVSYSDTFDYPLHHYALVDDVAALYEIIASKWTSQRLSDDEMAQALARPRGSV